MRFIRTNETVDSTHKPNMVLISNGIHEFIISQKSLVMAPINEVPSHSNWIDLQGGVLFAVYGTSDDNITVELIK